MKFLCPNCQAKYRIGPEKLQGRRVARIRCRKCDYRICIERKASGEGFEVTASPHSLPAAPIPAPPAAPPRAEPTRAAEPTPSTGRPPTAAVPGLPGLGSAPRSAQTFQRPGTREPVRNPVAHSPHQEPRGGEGNLADQFRRSVEQSEPEPSSELAKDGWFVGVNGVPLGPIPVGDLHELAVAGHIDRKSLVWREGFEEWRPLGKFPALVRIIDPDSQGMPGPPAPPPIASAGGERPGFGDEAAVGGGARANSGAEGPAPGPAAMLKPPPAASAPRRPPASSSVASHGSAAVAVGAPSAWADLDEEDDEDEAPTTVRGRVSAPPAGMATASVAGAAPLPPPAAAPSAPPAPRAPASAISTTPEPMVEAAEVVAPAGGGRRKVWILAPVALIALTTLIYFFYRLGQQSGQPGTASPGAAPTEETLEQRVPVRQPAKADDRAPEEEEQPDEEPSASEPAEEEAEEPLAREPAKAPAGSFANRYRPKKKAERVTVEAAAEETKPSKPSLLAGLSTSQTTGPTSVAKKEVEATGGTGLDGTAISRVVSKGSRSVKRSCWQRALTARAPGVPANAKVNAEIEISPNGSVRSVRASGPQGYPGLAKCIEARIRTWRFPRASASTTTRVPFVFVGQ